MGQPKEDGLSIKERLEFGVEVNEVILRDRAEGQ